MIKRLISICIVAILVFSLCGCAYTAEDIPAAETEIVKTENTNAADAGTEIVEIENTENDSEKGADEAETKNDEPVTVIAKVNHYYTDESLNSGSEYEYDSEGNMTRRTDYDADGSVDGWSEWEYDSSGNLIRQAQYNADGSNYGTRTEWEYDTEGKLMRCISYDVDGSVVDRYEYKYDSEGNLTEEINCGNNGSTYFRTEYEYDSVGNLTKVTEYYLSHRIESEYITITPQ